MVALRAAIRGTKPGRRYLHATDAFSAGAAVLVGLEPVVFTVSGNIYQRLASGLGIDPRPQYFTAGGPVWPHTRKQYYVPVKVCGTGGRKTGAKESCLYEIPLGVETENFLHGMHFPHLGGESTIISDRAFGSRK